MATPNTLNATPHGPWDDSGNCVGTIVSYQRQTVDATGARTNVGTPIKYVVTNLNYSLSSSSSGSDSEIDVSHIGQGYGEEVLSQPTPLIGSTTGASDTGREVQIDFIGTDILEEDQDGLLTIDGGIKWGPGKAKVTSSNVTLAVNDVIRGSVTFALEKKAIESAVAYSTDCEVNDYSE